MLSKLLLLLAIVLSARAEDIYVSGATLGTGSGVDAENAKSNDWLNTAGSWGDGAGKVSAGDTVYFTGTLTNGVVIQGNNVTFKWLAGSKISMPAGGGYAYGNPALANSCIYCVNRTGITLDGQGVGVIECTANGSELTYQLLVKMIQADGCVNLTVKGLTLKNGYVHTLSSDALLDPGTQGGIKAASMSGTWLIENCTFTNIVWCIAIGYSQPTLSTLVVRGNRFDSYDHGLALAMGSGQPIDITIQSNYFGSTVNWDTDANRYHHDGIHYYGEPTNTVNFTISHNTFAGDWGANNTAHVFLETGPQNVKLFNNLFIQETGQYLNNGFVNFIPSGAKILNNTIIGSGSAFQIGYQIVGAEVEFVNNITSGVSTYLTTLSSSGSSFSVIRNNIYAEKIPSGNAAYRINGTNYATFSAWTNAFLDAGSMWLTNDTLSDLGIPTSNSATVDSGATLTNFTTDIVGATRTEPWDIGAFEYTAAVPAISSQPTSLYRQIGTSATFTISASGTAPLAYQWLKGASAITDATNSTYTISSCVLGDAGSYSCVVTNAYGSATSSGAVLSVTDVKPRAHIRSQ